MEFEAIDEGTIAQILVPEGTDNVKVGTVIARISGEGEERLRRPRLLPPRRPAEAWLRPPRPLPRLKSRAPAVRAADPPTSRARRWSS